MSLKMLNWPQDGLGLPLTEQSQLLVQINSMCGVAVSSQCNSMENMQTGPFPLSS